MPTEPAIADFLDLVQRSGIVPADQMEQLLEEYGRRTDVDTAGKIAHELVARDLLTRWQADKLLQGKYKNFILGPYRILKPLGRGGMGTVYLAQHCVMRRYCAIKVLPSRSPKDDSSMLDRFYREAQAVAALDHPNIVRAYDVNKEVQKNTVVHYLVMEYVKGQDLQAKVDEHGVLGYRVAAEYIRQAAEGLAHAHDAGLIHRDVKPANLLVDAKGVVKILDLGLARFYDDSQGAALTNQFGDAVLGTVDYLAPEQALDCHQVDARADIYSLGQTFYFLLTGHPPFPEGSVAQRLLAHQTRSPDPIDEERPDVPRDLVAIIEQMTNKAPADRYQTAREVADVLSAWLADRPSDSGFLPRVSLRRPSRASGLPDPTRSLPRGARPSTHGEPTRAGSSAAEDTDLELAPLDDEKPPRTSSGSQPGVKQQADEESPADSQATQAPDEAAAPSASAEPQAKSPEQAVPPDMAADLSDVSPPETDWMSTLLEEEALPESVAAAGPVTLPSLSRPELTKPDRSSEGSLIGRLVKQPVFWVVVAGFVVALLVVALVLGLSNGPEEGRRQAPASARSMARTAAPAVPPGEGELETPAQGDAKASDRPETAPSARAKAAPKGGAVPGSNEPSPADGREKPAGTGPGKKPATAGPRQEERSPQTRDAKPTGGPRGHRPREEPGRPSQVPAASQGTGKPPSPSTTQQRGLPGTEVGPPAGRGPDAGEEPKAASPGEEPAKRLDPDEMRARLAAIPHLSFVLASADRNPRSKLNMLIRQEAIQAAERAGLAVIKDDAAVMHLTLEMTNADGLVGFVMSAELKCRDADAGADSDSDVFTVWEHKEQVATVAPDLLRRPLVPAPLKTGVGDFFDQFVKDYRRAQAEKDPTRAPEPD
jgi:serine/threonine-protein kinase